jgi:hypothetical protein
MDERKNIFFLILQNRSNSLRKHLLMNLAVGGNWGGSKGIDESIWPQRLEIDYVRVYE